MPYTTEQLRTMSTTFRAARLSMESAVAELREMARDNRDQFVCEYSGELIEGTPFVIHEFSSYDWRTSRRTYHYPHYYADEQAAIADGCVRCSCCDEWTNGNWNDEVTELDGNTYCSYDCANDSGYHTCERCGEWYHEDYEVYTGEYGYCSEYCAERDGWRRCDHCGDWTNETWTVGGEEWCDSCDDHDAAVCEGCGDHFPTDDMIWDEEGYCWYCCDCAEPHVSAEIHSYNYTPRLTFFGGEGVENPLFFGTELETDSGSSRRSYARALASIEGFSEHFYMKNDGSLCDGIEIVSHPMTLAYHDSIRGIYEHIGAAARANGFVSHDSGNCGLHVHGSSSFFGRSKVVQDACKYKLMRLFQRFERQLTTFSRRTSDRWCHYATSADYEPKKDVVNVRDASGIMGEPSVLAKSRNFVDYDRDKYRAVNILHPNTVEIRIFNGTLKWSTYFASLALVEGMFRAVKMHGSTWVETVSWYNLIDEVVANVGVEFPKLCLVNYLNEKGLR